MTTFSLSDLEAIIQSRASASAAESYTRSLLEAGVARTARKFGEEAIEVIIAATQGDRAAVVAESADVCFHLLVMLRACDITLAEVMSELERRTGISGHAEKASRTK